MRFLVTAGPTREFIDPFRFLSNPSTGRMGYALAAAARNRGFPVTLISGPVCLEPPPGATLIPVNSAREMYAAVRAGFPSCDVLVMAAAVADWRPAEISRRKLKKTGRRLLLELVRNPDILAELGREKGGRILVGFAAETDNLVDYARDKLEHKNLDMIVANDISRRDSGFASPTNRLIILRPGVETEYWPVLPKEEAAERLVKRISESYEDG